VTCISLEAFTFFFRPSVRVLFDWRRFEREGWPIDMQVLDDYCVISRWYMPWNINEERRLVNYDAPGAHPIQLNDVPEIFPQFASSRQRLILNLKRTFQEERTPVQLVVAGYVVKDDVRLLLDGNHRLAALFLSSVPFRLMSFNIHGPLEGSIVPELRHWESISRDKLSE
jgi:hypothetical protein